jgi:hypothetical protein
MGGICSSIAGAAGVEAPTIDEKQMEQITDVVVTEIGSYTPKFSVAYCAILAEESKKRRKDKHHVELELKSQEITKHTEDAIKMADDKDFDPTTCTAKVEDEQEEKDEGLKDKIKEAAASAVESALAGDEDDDGDDDGSGAASNVTSETVRDSVVRQLGSLRADLIAKMSNVPEAISERVVDAALGKAAEKAIFKVLVQFATIHVKEWNKLIKQKKNPKRIFKRGQKVCKSIKDVKSLKDNVTDLTSAVQDGNVLGAAKATKGAAEDAQGLHEDRENMKQIKHGKDNSHSNSGGDD